jgi:Uma2 family endonuclease
MRDDRAMSAALRALTTEEFLAWERAQPERYEFDGIQPIGMAGGSPAHAATGASLIVALGNRLRSPCRVFTGDLKVPTTGGRVRYPDVTVACGSVDNSSDLIAPVVVFEVMSPSSALTDRRVKPREYAGVPSILACVVLDQTEPEVLVFRRSDEWRESVLRGTDAVLALPEIGVEIPLSAIYGA